MTENFGTATCYFCGQRYPLPLDLHELDPAQANEWATWRCTCTQAVKERARKEEEQRRADVMARAAEALEDVLKDAEQLELAPVLMGIIEKVYEGEITRATFQLYGPEKVKIAQTSKGTISITYTKTGTKSREV